jgi:hypothetical protein
MNTPRFNYEGTSGEPLRLRPQEYSKWIPVSHIGDRLRRVSTDSRRRKIFAIVTLSTPSEFGRRTTRRVLIFDNHPDSLRLVVGHRADSLVHRSDRRRTSSSAVALLWILVVGLMMGMFWPIF